MRELGGYHGEHRRHGRHAGDAPHGRNGAADAHAGHASDVHARNSPERAAQDALKLKMATDPEARKAAFFKNQRNVEASNAEYAARHAKPRDGERTRIRERPEPQETKPEHAPVETGDKATGKIAQKRKPAERQELKQEKPERSWLPRADMVKVVSDVGMLGTAVAVALGDVPARWDAVAAAGCSAVVSAITWVNRRWKEKHGDRPEG